MDGMDERKVNIEPYIRQYVEAAINEAGSAFQFLRNRKPPGEDGLQNELLKCGINTDKS